MLRALQAALAGEGGVPDMQAALRRLTHHTEVVTMGGRLPPGWSPGLYVLVVGPDVSGRILSVASDGERGAAVVIEFERRWWRWQRRTRRKLARRFASMLR